MTSHKMASPLRKSLSPWFICGLLVLLLAACSSGQASPSSFKPQPTQQTSPGPFAVAALLDPAPQNCSANPGNSSGARPVFNGSSTGRGPVWENGLPPDATLNLDQLGFTPWPGNKIVWPIPPDFPSAVTVQVTNMKTGAEAWWDVGEGSPAPKKPVRPLIMNPMGNKTGKPPIWGTFLYLPQAGCYEMTVSWQSGQWHLLFAAGR